MKNFSLALVLGLSTIVYSMGVMTTHSATAEEKLKEIAGTLGGCTKARLKLKQYKKEFPKYHFSFAGRKDSTITGIRGCGYAWDKNSQAKADGRAMNFCKKQEEKLGTDGGKKVCKLFPL